MSAGKHSGLALPLLPALLIALLNYYPSPQRPSFHALDTSAPVILSGRTMGTIWQVRLGHEIRLTDEKLERLRARIESTLERINTAMSTYRSDSELSQFNALPPHQPFRLRLELAHVFEHALRIQRESHGALDVAVGALVDAYGFGATPPNLEQAQLESLRKTAHGRFLHLDRRNRTLQKTQPLRCDLSAIAKGYAVDAVVADLRNASIYDFLVEIGGELYAAGRRSLHETWRVGIELPDEVEILGTWAFSDRAMATSGDYRQYRIVAGRRITHIVDPRTGESIGHTLAAVTVIAEDCMNADAWATALMVAGPEEGMRLAQAHRLEVLFVIRTQDGYRIATTAEFPQPVQ